MRTIFIFFIVLMCFTARAQNITNDQLSAYAHKLYEAEILSEKGRDMLKGQVKWNMLDNRTVPGILMFCAIVYNTDLYYRSGLLDYSRLMEELSKKEKITTKDLEKMEKELEEMVLQSEGYKIEQAIAAEDSIAQAGLSIGGELMSIGETGLAHPKRSVMGKTRTRLIEDIYKIKLINERVYDELKKLNGAGRLITESEILMYASERVLFYENFPEHKSREMALLDSLKKKNVLSEDGYKRLLSTYKEYEIKEKYDYIAYCNNALVFHLAKHPRDPAAFYSKVFDEIKKIVPGFGYKNLEVKIISDNDEAPDLIWQKLSISFEADGRKYTNISFYDFLKKDPSERDNADTLPKVAEEFYKVINEWLRDTSSPYRLYYAHDPRINKEPADKQFGLILMTEEQFKAWQTDGTSYFLSGDDHSNELSSGNIEKIISKYEQLGLFSHLGAEEISAGKKKVQESDINNYSDILLCFPKTIVYFDWEMSNLDDPYTELTKMFADASRGNFKPERIKDNFGKRWKKKTCDYSFVLNGKKYEQELFIENDWLDAAFFDLIQRAIKENGEPGQFYYCLDNGQETGFIFLTKSQLEVLKKEQPALFPM